MKDTYVGLPPSFLTGLGSEGRLGLSGARGWVPGVGCDGVGCAIGDGSGVHGAGAVTVGRTVTAGRGVGCAVA